MTAKVIEKKKATLKEKTISATRISETVCKLAKNLLHPKKIIIIIQVDVKVC